MSFQICLNIHVKNYLIIYILSGVFRGFPNNPLYPVNFKSNIEVNCSLPLLFSDSKSVQIYKVLFSFKMKYNEILFSISYFELFWQKYSF